MLKFTTVQLEESDLDFQSYIWLNHKTSWKIGLIYKYVRGTISGLCTVSKSNRNICPADEGLVDIRVLPWPAYQTIPPWRWEATTLFCFVFLNFQLLFLTNFVLLSLDTEIKGDILFLGYYESEFDWSNETAKVKLPLFCGWFAWLYNMNQTIVGASIVFFLSGLQTAQAKAIPQPDLCKWL